MPWNPLNKANATPVGVPAGALAVYQSSIPTVATSAARDALLPANVRPMNYRVRNQQTGWQEAWKGAAVGWVQEVELTTGTGGGGAELPDPADALAGEPYLVVVTPNPISLMADSSLQLLATIVDIFGTPTATGNLTWQAFGTGIAGISSTGLLSGLSPGAATLRATVTWVREGETSPRTARSSLVPITVTGPVTEVLITPGTVPLQANSSLYVSVVSKDAGGRVVAGRAPTFDVANEATATVSVGGEVVGVAAGTTELSVVVDGVEAVADIAVTGALHHIVLTPAGPSTIAEDETLQLVAQGQDAANNPIPGLIYNWLSDNTVAALVSSTGLVSVGAGSGTTTVRVSATTPESGTIEASTSITTTRIIQFRYIVGDNLEALGAILLHTMPSRPYVDQLGITRFAGPTEFRDEHHIDAMRCLLVESTGGEGRPTVVSGEYEHIRIPFLGSLTDVTVMFDVISAQTVSLAAFQEAAIGRIGHAYPDPFFGFDVYLPSALAMFADVKARQPDGQTSVFIPGHGFADWPAKGTRLTWRAWNIDNGDGTFTVNTALSIDSDAEIFGSAPGTGSGNPEVFNPYPSDPAMVALALDTSGTRPCNLGILRVIVMKNHDDGTPRSAAELLAIT